MVCTRGRGRIATAQWFASRIGLPVAVLAVAMALMPAGASAEPLCTDTWTGPSEGAWEESADWSASHAPTSSDVACIGAGKTVTLASGSGVAGVLQGAGSLKVEGRAALEVTNVLEASVIANLAVEEASLTVTGEVQVTSSFLAGRGGSLYGSGTVAIQPGATGSITPIIANVFYVYATLENAGTFTIGESAALSLESRAQLVNSGTLIVNGQGGRGLRGSSATVVNTGTMEKTAGTEATLIETPIDNEGTVLAASGVLEFVGGGSTGAGHAGTWSASGPGTQILLNAGERFSLGSSVTLNGALEIARGTVEAGKLEGEAAKVTVNTHAVLNLTGVGTSLLREFIVTDREELNGGRVELAGTLLVSSSLSLGGYGTLEGVGTVALEAGGTGSIPPARAEGFAMEGGHLDNYGTFTIGKGSGVKMSPVTSLVNYGTLIVNGETPMDNHGIQSEGPTPENVFENFGTLKKTEGAGETLISAIFRNYGPVIEETGEFSIEDPVYQHEDVFGGEENPSAPQIEIEPCGEGVGCSNGNYSQTQTDFSIGGRGVGLTLARTYNSQAAANGVHGIFGYGWVSSFSDRLVAEPEHHLVVLDQANGGSVAFTESGGEAFTAPEWTQDTLKGSSSTGYTLTLEDQTKYGFAGSGRLESVTDRNGNATTLSYTAEGRLEKITDPAGRSIELAYNGEGLVESAEDPMKHVVKYTYSAGNLASVTQPGEAALRWQFEYDGSHQMTELTDGRSGHWHMEYNVQHQVSSQKDPMERQTTFEYLPFMTVSDNHATGAKTVEAFTSMGQPVTRTSGYGTASATTETFSYDKAGLLLGSTDGDGDTTKYQYDAHGNRILKEEPEGNKTKWAYDSAHDVETETLPGGETTTYKRDADGNPEVVERAAPGVTTQATSYKYTAHGQVESMKNPLEHTWKYEYDSAGDKVAEIDPEGDKRTWGYNEDSQETSVVSPRGHVKAGEESKFTTTTERDAQGRAIKVTDPLEHETKYTYDGDGNVETMTDPEGQVTTYTYDADNEKTKTKEADGSVTETGYDGAGQMVSQTDGNKHTTKYERNVLEQVVEVVDPLGRKTLEEHDGAGNLVKLTDPAKRTTTYKYDKDNRLVQRSYSDGKTPTVKYEYNANGDPVKMEDGTGTTTWEYDQLDRLTKTKDGHGGTVSYEYDLANEPTKITYPSGKAVIREYDDAGRLGSVKDWSERTTKFTYDADNQPAATVFPSATGDEDAYSYDDADAISEVKMSKGAETLASLAYTRDNHEHRASGRSGARLQLRREPATDKRDRHDLRIRRSQRADDDRLHRLQIRRRRRARKGRSLKSHHGYLYLRRTRRAHKNHAHDRPGDHLHL